MALCIRSKDVLFHMNSAVHPTVVVVGADVLSSRVISSEVSESLMTCPTLDQGLFSSPAQPCLSLISSPAPLLYVIQIKGRSPVSAELWPWPLWCVENSGICYNRIVQVGQIIEGQFWTKTLAGAPDGNSACGNPIKKGFSHTREPQS